MTNTVNTNVNHSSDLLKAALFFQIALSTIAINAQLNFQLINSIQLIIFTDKSNNKVIKCSSVWSAALEKLVKFRTYTNTLRIIHLFLLNRHHNKYCLHYSLLVTFEHVYSFKHTWKNFPNEWLCNHWVNLHQTIKTKRNLTPCSESTILLMINITYVKVTQRSNCIETVKRHSQVLYATIRCVIYYLTCIRQNKTFVNDPGEIRE